MVLCRLDETLPSGCVLIQLQMEAEANGSSLPVSHRKHTAHSTQPPPQGGPSGSLVPTLKKLAEAF